MLWTVVHLEFTAVKNLDGTLRNSYLGYLMPSEQSKALQSRYIVTITDIRSEIVGQRYKLPWVRPLCQGQFLPRQLDSSPKSKNNIYADHDSSVVVDVGVISIDRIDMIAKFLLVKYGTVGIEFLEVCSNNSIENRSIIRVPRYTKSGRI